MAASPQIAYRDGSGFTTELNFTTNQETVTLTGTVEVNTAALQISINGAPFVSDSSLLAYTLQSFTVPNIDSYPSGLPLELGNNVIQLRTIDVSGGVSAASTANITRVKASSDIVSQIPTAIRLRRRRDRIVLRVAKPNLVTDTGNRISDDVLLVPSTTSFRGFNFYASTTPAGTAGYYRINDKPVQTPLTYEEDVLTTSNDLAIWDNTTLKKIRLKITEENDLGQELAIRLDKVYDAASLGDKLRINSTLDSYRLQELVEFSHTRSGGTGIINSDQWVNVADSEPLYYVVSGVYYDSAQGVEIETPYSQEVLGAPLVIDTTIQGLPKREFKDVTTAYMNAIMRVNQDIGIIPGSTTRDVSIDPFASETERLWFLLDFVHRCGSVLTLLQIDDADGDGTSDDPTLSAYKQALKAALSLQSDAAVQGLIDRQFDKLAGNVGKSRLPGRPAVGQAVLYTTSKPVRDVVIPADSFVSANADPDLNLPSVRFRIGGSYVISVRNIDSYYNFEKKRWQIIVDIVCETSGDVGNRAAGTIKSIAGVSGVLITNDESTIFGKDRETNAELAERTLLGFSSVDAGTEGGYASTAAEQRSIIKSKIVKSGDTLMMRDYDTVRKKHAGGKVDIWIQGTRERTVSETFAFTYEIARDIQLQIIDLSTLTFRVLDSRVTLSTPIIEILSNNSQGFGVRNVTTGQSYDLTGLTVIDYQTFRLNTGVTQPTTMIDDLLTADYRFRVVNKFFFSYQPARRIISVTGEVSGALDPTTNYSLYKTDDPLLNGESTIAQDYLSLIQFGGRPSGSSISVNNEAHVLIGTFQEPLGAVGINTKTVRVFSADRSTEYDGPDTSAPDFDLIEGTPTTPALIVRTSSSSIGSGDSISVDYSHDENFTVTYVINDLLQQFQNIINTRKHTTADVLVKQAVDNSLDVETTVQLQKGKTRDKVDPLIQTNVSIELNRKTIGQGSAQSDLIRAIDSTTGVEYQVVPFGRMAYSDGSRKLRETVLSTYVHVGSLDIGGNLAYLLTNALVNPTTDGGGLMTEHHGVFQDTEGMTLATSLASVATGPNQAFIIGNAGVIIVGYSDDATLESAGFVTSEDKENERYRRTANHVVVALPLGSDLTADTPDKHDYAVSYVIRGDSGAHDIVASQVEYISLGNLILTSKTAS